MAEPGGKGVQRIGFAYNPTSDAAVELRERASGWAQMRDLDNWAAPAADREALHRELPGTDVLIVLGGDGTFLRAARAVIEDDVPLLGINVGKVGFLCDHPLGTGRGRLLTLPRPSTQYHL